MNTGFIFISYVYTFLNLSFNYPAYGVMRNNGNFMAVKKRKEKKRNGQLKLFCFE